MDFIFVSTVWKIPICIEGPAFGAHIRFLGWVESGYGQFEVWTNVGSVCPFQHTHWILVLRFLQFQHRVWTSIYEGRLFVLFCNYEIHRTGMLQIMFFGVFGKLSMRRGAWAWTCSAKVFEYLMIFSLKIELSRSWIFLRNWNVPLVLLERSWWAGFNGIYLVRFGFRMWEILIFKWFLPLKIQINSQKPGFGRKNQLRTTLVNIQIPLKWTYEAGLYKNLHVLPHMNLIRACMRYTSGYIKYSHWNNVSQLLRKCWLSTWVQGGHLVFNFMTKEKRKLIMQLLT